MVALEHIRNLSQSVHAVRVKPYHILARIDSHIFRHLAVLKMLERFFAEKFQHKFFDIITQQVKRVLYDGESASAAVDALLAREPKAEAL